MKFKGVVFDLDGTLVNSLEDLADSMNNVLEKHGYPTHGLKAYKYFIGNGIKNLVREALPEACRNEELIATCYNLMVEEYESNCLNKTRPYDGITELLHSLANEGLKLAVLSNKNHDLTQKVVSTTLPDCNFAIVQGFSPEIPRKPDPAGALLISRQLGIEPDSLIYLGDTSIDMQTANSAGMYAVGALWGFRTKEELIANGARHWLSRPMELIEILNVE